MSSISDPVMVARDNGAQRTGSVQEGKEGQRRQEGQEEKVVRHIQENQRIRGDLRTANYQIFSLENQVPCKCYFIRQGCTTCQQVFNELAASNIS